MATNKVFEPGDELSVVVSSPASPVSGDAVRFGVKVGVATTDERADGTTSVDFGGVFDLPTKGEDNGGNAPISAGDALFFDDAKAFLNADATGTTPAGVALEDVASGVTATIRVRLIG